MATLIENLYVKLKLMLVKKDEAKNNALLAHLKKINDHLANRNTRFLTGDTMCCFDCELMPRLQHIRVAGKYFVDFEIPVCTVFTCSICKLVEGNRLIGNFIFRHTTWLCGGTCTTCISWTPLLNHVLPIRTSLTTTNCNRCLK